MITLVLLILVTNSDGQTTVCDAIFPKPHLEATFGNPYSNRVTLSYAQKITHNYIANSSTQVDKEIGYFVFDAGSLFKYIYNIKSQVQDIQFLLGRDQNGTLTMIVVGLPYDHKTLLYYSDEKCTNCVLAMPLTGELTDEFETLDNNPNPPVTSATINVCTGVNFPVSNISGFSYFIPKENAAELITKYGKPAGKPTSFLFDAGMIADFLASTNNIQNVAAVFAKDGTSKTSVRLLLIGVDKAGNPLPLDIGGFSYALEHCYPCPEDCPGISPALEIRLLMSK